MQSVAAEPYAFTFQPAASARHWAMTWRYCGPLSPRPNGIFGRVAPSAVLLDALA
jgi:hypothetical protein